MFRQAVLIAMAVLGAGSTAGVAGAQTPPVVVQPGAPGQPSKIVSADAVAKGPRPGVTAGDVRFMQGMIGHHAQALEMTKLLETRTDSADMRKLARRIEVSQADEIQMMEEWLKARGQSLPDPHAHHAHGTTPMPGMLSADEMARLAAARGTAFDRLFLEYMIKHHEGALSMVRELFSTPGAGQESEIYAFASEVDADQRMEIDRMRAMLKELR